MSYPNLPISRESVATREGGFVPARATNGVLKVRRLYSTEKMTFDIVHLLSVAQKNQLEAAYQSFKTANLTLLWPEDGTSYTVRFVAAPSYIRQPGFWRCIVKLLEA